MTLLTNSDFWIGCAAGAVFTVTVAYAVNVWVNTVFTPKRGL
jgi:hypothetical protein